MSKIDQMHLRAVVLCMSKTSKMGKEHTHFAQHHLQRLCHTYIALIFCTIFHTFIEWYVCYVSQHLQHQTMCIDTCPLMYTQQIR